MGNNITLTTNAGAVTQTQPITATGLELLGAGAYTLTNGSNNVATLAANTTNAISYTDADNLAIGTVGGTVNLSSTTGGVALVVGGTLTPTSVSSGTGAISVSANTPCAAPTRARLPLNAGVFPDTPSQLSRRAGP